MIRVDGDANSTAASEQEIHALAMSLRFTVIEINKINSLGSWNGGVLVIVSGSLKTKEFSGKRKFMQTFFLAPQEKGYFILNDIFQFIDDSMVEQRPVPLLSEKEIEVHLNVSSPHSPVSDYVMEEEPRENASSIHIENNPFDKYCLTEQQQQVFKPEVKTVQEPLAPVVEEHVGEPEHKTYASILRASSITSQPSFKMRIPTASNCSTFAQTSNYAIVVETVRAPSVEEPLRASGDLSASSTTTQPIRRSISIASPSNPTPVQTSNYETVVETVRESSAPVIEESLCASGDQPVSSSTIKRRVSTAQPSNCKRAKGDLAAEEGRGRGNQRDAPRGDHRTVLAKIRKTLGTKH